MAGKHKGSLNMFDFRSNKQYDEFFEDEKSNNQLTLSIESVCTQFTP